MSGNEIMLALSKEVETTDRYQAPSVIYYEGFLDRRHERQHALAIRDMERNARESVATAAAEAARDIAWMQARARVNTEAKFQIDRAQKESQIIAQGDAVKQAKYDILDDEYFAQTRVAANRPVPQFGRLFG